MSAPGLFMHLPGTVTQSDVEIEGALYDVAIVLDRTAEGGVRATAVTVTAHDGSPPVTGTTLRAVRVWDLVQQAILLAAHRGRRKVANEVTTTEVLTSTLSDADAEQLRLHGPTDKSLEWVAHFYNLAQAVGLPPAKQVQLAIGLPRTTATKWIKRARDKGLLSPKGEQTDGKH